MEAFNEETKEKNVDGKKGDVGTKLADVSSNLLELVLERCDLGGCFLGDLHDLTDGRVISNHNGDHLAFTAGDGRTRHHDGRR